MEEWRVGEVGRLYGREVGVIESVFPQTYPGLGHKSLFGKHEECSL